MISDTSMTLDEAIVHCEEAAARLRHEDPCSTCAAEHEQLGMWLKELKVYREIVNQWKSMNMKV